MNITNIFVRIIENTQKLKGVATVTFDNVFAVRDIKIVEGKEGLYMAMPSKKLIIQEKETYQDIAYPLAPGFRSEMQKAVIEAYEKELEKQKVKK